MTDHSQYTEEEQKTLDLVIAFNKAVQEKVEAAAEAEKEFGEKVQAIVESHKASFEALDDDALDAKLVSVLMEQNPPLSEERAAEEVEKAPRGALVQFLSGKVEDAGSLSDDELKAAAVPELMKQNPGLSEDRARQSAEGAGREQKIGFLASAEARSEIEGLGQPPMPAFLLQMTGAIEGEVIEELAVDIEALDRDAKAFIEKYGQETLQSEVENALGVSEPQPQPGALN